MRQKNNMAAAGQVKSRRALGDIGNMVTLQPNGKPLPSRPVTRIFCAQLLANAQKDLAENKKKAVGVNVENVNKMVPKKKATVKPKPQPVPQNVTVIEISPDTEVKSKPESSSKRNKKPQSSLTSTLTARSKDACGLNYKPKQKNIIDIDALDVDNELAAVEYVEDVYKFYKLVEILVRNVETLNKAMEVEGKRTRRELAAMEKELAALRNPARVSTSYMYN